MGDSPRSDSDGSEIGWQADAAASTTEKERAALALRSGPAGAVGVEEAAERSLMSGPAGPQALARCAELSTALSVSMEEGVNALCAQFSSDGSLAVIGCSDGSVRAHSTTTGKLMHRVRVEEGSPVTALRMRVSSAETQNVVMFATADGHVRYWHVTSGRFLGSPVSEAGNSILAMDVNPAGARVATGGEDSLVRIYDTSSRTLLSTLGSRMEGAVGAEQSSSSGHSSHVYALRWCDEHTLLSGGWDNIVHLWDMRQGEVVRSISGPHLCGDAMDVTDGRIVTTGSNRRYRALQQWDLGSGSLLHDVPWLPAAPDAPPCLLYAVRAGRPGGAAAGCVAAGGSGAAEVRVVCVDDHKTCSLACGAPLARLHGLPSAVYALAFDADETRLLVVCADAVRLALVPAA